jgi:hypothetical protein
MEKMQAATLAALVRMADKLGLGRRTPPRVGPGPLLAARPRTANNEMVDYLEVFYNQRERRRLRFRPHTERLHAKTRPR